MDNTPTCTFCKLQTMQEFVWENEYFFSLFDDNPISRGHTLVIPKRHIVNFKDLLVDEWISLQQSIQDNIHIIESTDFIKVYKEKLENPLSDTSTWFLTKALQNSTNKKIPDAYNHGINDGRAAGRTVDHLHWHIIPRYTNDTDNPRGGIRNLLSVIDGEVAPLV